MDRPGKPSRAKLSATPPAVRKPRARRAKKRGKPIIVPTRWPASNAIVAAMAAPQIMAGPMAFFAPPPLD
jgi:hypothetical protein